jgi:hypothetical protein
MLTNCSHKPAHDPIEFVGRFINHDLAVGFRTSGNQLAMTWDQR